ncbi:MAG TPA: hypothetical protein VHL31_03510 [Geminicoccus sp.]|uniref:hypothetical protein n=1 Tax=Geminicoccus sp. TaxID=2024832 RepID=UPI002E369EA7|nr:hypothetical protein [Geminicoccus sp.]HEX2525355.1 hypothetical protein [Geminicoccus sp.]
MTTAVGLGAAAASAQEPAVATYNDQKSAVIDVKDETCKVPLKIKGQKIDLYSNDVKIDIKKVAEKKKYYKVVKCEFKDKDIKRKFLFYKDVIKKNFECKVDFGKEYAKTKLSAVAVNFKKYGKVAKVDLVCWFKIDKPTPPKHPEPPKYPPQPPKAPEQPSY